MKQSVKMAIFMCLILSIAYVSASSMQKKSEADREKELAKHLDKQLKAHPEKKKEIVLHAYQHLHDMHLKRTIEKLYLHNITNKMAFNSKGLTLSLAADLLYDDEYHHELHELIHEINHEVWDMKHHSLHEHVNKYLNHVFVKTFNSSDEQFMVQVNDKDSYQGQKVRHHVKKLIKEQLGQKKYQHFTLTYVVSKVYEEIEALVTGKVKNEAAAVKKDDAAEKKNEAAEKNKEQAAEKKELTTKLATDGKGNNTVPGEQLIRLVEHALFDELHVHHLKKHNHVHVHHHRLIKLVTQLIAAKHLSPKQQQNISHGLELLNEKHFKQILKTVEKNERIQKLEKPAEAHLGDLVFKNGAELVKELHTLVHHIQDDSVYQVKVVDNINDISSDDVAAVNLKKELPVPQSIEIVVQDLQKHLDHHHHHHHHLNQVKKTHTVEIKKTVEVTKKAVEITKKAVAAPQTPQLVKQQSNLKAKITKQAKKL